MNIYRANEVFPVGSGVVGMTAEQARRRVTTGMLKPAEGDVSPDLLKQAEVKPKNADGKAAKLTLFDVVSRFQLKAGEVFAWDEEPGKGVNVDCLTPSAEETAVKVEK